LGPTGPEKKYQFLKLNLLVKGMIAQISLKNNVSSGKAEATGHNTGAMKMHQWPKWGGTRKGRIEGNLPSQKLIEFPRKSYDMFLT